MDRHTRLVMLGVLLMMVFPFAVNVASAARPPHPRRLPWSGNQIPALQEEWEVTVVPRGNHVLVKGARMICYNPITGPDPDPYVFGDTLVFCETIDWMVIFMDPLEFVDHPELAASAKRFGQFTWYDRNGHKVAEGGFRFSGKDEPGYLWAKGDGFIAEAIFYPTHLGMWHEGWYMTTGNS